MEGRAIEIETRRLVLRRLCEGDFESLCGIIRDDDTMYAYGGALGEGEAREWLARQLSRYREYGFGAWAVVLKETGEFAGQIGITMQDAGPLGRVHEIGYLLNRAHWGMGYATEAGLACREYAFSRLGVPAVYSIIRDTNVPSIRVAKRLGMSACAALVKHYRGIEMPHTVFRVENPARLRTAEKSPGIK